jgi:hypothetical protein
LGELQVALFSAVRGALQAERTNTSAIQEYRSCLIVFP